MSANKRAAPRKFDDILDLIKAFDKEGDEDPYSDTRKEVTDADFKAETRRRRAAWAAMPDEDKQVVRVGEAIFERLLLLEMRQAELARRLDKDRAWVSRVVQGRENLTVRTLACVAAALECEVADLLRPGVETASRKIMRPQNLDAQRTIAEAKPVLRVLRLGFRDAQQHGGKGCRAPEEFDLAA